MTGPPVMLKRKAQRPDDGRAQSRGEGASGKCSRERREGERQTGRVGEGKEGGERESGSERESESERA